jgi:hypothetical protein
MKLTDKQYIRELELSLIFMCDVYNSAKESLTTCRETIEKQNSDKYDMWLHFPMIQGTQNGFAIQKIGDLRTNLGNKEENLMSFNDIFERIHIGRKTNREINDEVKKLCNK